MKDRFRERGKIKKKQDANNLKLLITKKKGKRSADAKK